MKFNKASLLTGLLLFFSTTIMAQAPEGYYDSLEGKSGSSLKQEVKAIAKKGHHAISYGTSTWNAFKSTDVRTEGNQSYWWDMYSDNNVGVSDGAPSSMNIEHSVANSWWGGTKNDAYKDIVHLNPSDKDANSRKGNYPLGEINGSPTWNNGVTFIGHPKSGQGNGCTLVFEPHDMYKGDFARVFMYMFTVYDDITWKEASSSSSDGKGRMYDYSGGKAQFQTWASELLLRWSAADPVSEKEIYRNNGIQKEQGNRNPFIDLPDLAEYIWGSKKNEAYHLGATEQPDPTIPEDPEIEDPQPGEDDPIIFDPTETAGKYLRAETDADIIDGHRYVIVASETGVALSTLTGKDRIHPTSAVTIEDNVITDLPDNTAIVTLEKVDDNSYFLALSDTDGKEIGYIASSGAKKIEIVGSVDAGATAATISVSNGISEIALGSKNFLRYNANDNGKIFRPYASGQEPLSMYRFIETDIPSDVKEIPSDEFSIRVNGNSIEAPSGSLIFDISGRCMGAENLEKGLYIVVSPGKTTTTKVIITD